MANEERKVLLKVEIENAELVKRSGEIRTELDKLKKEKKSLDEALKNKDIGTKEYAQLQQQIVKNTAATNAYKKELSAVQKEIDTEIKIKNSAKGSNEQLRASLSLLTAQYNKLSGEERENTEEGILKQKTIKALSDALKENEEAVGDNRRSVGDYTKIIKPLIEALEKENLTIQTNNQELEVQRKSIADILKPTKDQTDQLNKINAQIEINNQKYKSNVEVINSTTSSIGFLAQKQQQAQEPAKTYANTLEGAKEELKDLQNLSKTLDLDSPEYKRVTERMSDIELKIGQASGKLDEFGRKEPKNKIKKNMDDTAEAVGALSQSIGLLTIAFSDNENVAQFQEKALKAIAITTTIANIAKARFAILDTIQLVKTKALTIGQNLLSLAIGRSTGAAKLFRVALAGTGVGAALILLGELIFNFKEVSKWVNRGINYLRDFSTQVSGGNKIVKGFVEILLLVISPLATIIRLIADFSGTIQSFQDGINGAADAIQGLIGDIPILSDLLEFNQAVFNKVTNSIKSLDSSSKKYKVSVEDLNKIYDTFNDNLSKNSKNLERQITLSKAQGKSEGEVAAMTKKLLAETTRQREQAFNIAMNIQKRLIKENGKLNEEQQKLFDKVQSDFEDAKLQQEVFLAEQNQIARERAAERLSIEKDLQAELNALKNGLIKNEFDRREAELKESFRLEQQAIEDQIKEQRKKGTLTEKIQSQLDEKLKLLNEKLNQDLRENEQDRLKFEEEQRKEFYEQWEKDVKASAAFRSAELTKSFNEEMKILDATFVNTGRNEREKLDQIRLFNIQKLELSKAYFEDQLKLAEEFAKKDGKLTEDELNGLTAISETIANIDTQIKELEERNILGLTAEEMKNINDGAQAFLNTLQIISDAINANFENRRREVDDLYDAEIEGIENSALSKEQKEKKIEDLEKKRAEAQYKIQLEQFEFQKATATIQAIIQGALAFITALTSGVPPFNFINAGITALATGVQIGVINSQSPPPKPSFFDGGFTEQSGNPRAVSRYSNSRRDLHHDEYVTPAKVLKNPKAWPYISALESMRLNTPGKLGLSGFADGGLNSRSMLGDISSQEVMARTISNEVAKNLEKVNIWVSASELNRVSSKMGQAKANATA